MERTFLSRLLFGNIHDKASYTLERRLDSSSLLCDQFSVTQSPEIEAQKFYLTYGNQILGAIKIVDRGYVEEVNLHVFYIEARCTFDTPGLEMPDVFATKGRLLWAYTLNYVFNIGGPNSIIYNSSFESAKPYHLKMGMTPYNESLFPAEFIPRVIMIEDNGIEETKEVLSEFNILFYKLKGVDYTKILNIIVSLPDSKPDEYNDGEIKPKPRAEFGGRKKTRKLKSMKRPKVKKLIYFT